MLMSLDYILVCKHTLLFTSSGTGEFIDVEPATMPKRAPPEAPGILRSQENKISYSPYPDTFTIRWSVPPDNGEVIKSFHINYYKVCSFTVKYIFFVIGFTAFLEVIARILSNL